MTENNVYYKVLGEAGKPYHGGTGEWGLPTKLPDGTWQPGEWMPRIEHVEPCQRGYHGCRPQDLIHWLGPTIWAMEYSEGEVPVVHESKVVGQQARLLYRYEAWNERTARLFACDCAERALHLTAPTEGGEPDARCVGAIAVARRYANGQATKRELAVASDAASDAARDVAWDPARAAASDAAMDAAWAAAMDAAWYAAWYAARAAARAAAWAAARAAARAAAGDAASDAEVGYQNERLMHYLKGEVA